MTTNNVPRREPQPDPSAAVAGLAREVEAMRRRLDQVADLPKRHGELATVVSELAAEVNSSHAAVGDREAPLSWLDAPTDQAAVAVALVDLVDWVGRVLLRYADAVKALPECWLWHPDVVEELLWLMQAWHNAYGEATGTLALAADWHDRYRPGVVKRIGESLAKNCSLENHLARAGHQEPGTPGVPTESAVHAIAGWWASARDESAPQPSAEQLDAAPQHNWRRR